MNENYLFNGDEVEATLKESPGFSIQTVYFFRSGELRTLKFLLPISSDTSLFVKTSQEKAEEQCELESHEKNVKLIAIREAKEQSTSPFFANSRSKKAGEFDIPAERKELKDQSSFDQLSDDDGDKVEVYGWDEPLKLIEHIKSATPDRDRITRANELYQRLKERGNFRKLATFKDSSSALKQLECLRADQPHFSSVLDLPSSTVHASFHLRFSMESTTYSSFFKFLWWHVILFNSFVNDVLTWRHVCEGHHLRPTSLRPTR